MSDYYTISEISKIWCVTPRNVQLMCANGVIEGAVKFGRSWAVPKSAKYPDDHRTREYRTYVAQHA